MDSQVFTAECDLLKFHDREFLLGRRSVKWGLHDNALPSFIAETDFATPAPVQKAIERVVREQDYGYPIRKPAARPEHIVSDAFMDRMERLYRWKIESGMVQPITNLVQATYAVLHAFSEVGEGVILQVPAYHPFFEAISSTQRKLLPIRLLATDKDFVHDFDAFSELARNARILLLCNPQNPTGRVFSREELEEMGRIAIENDLLILSDEVHSDFVYPGNVHIPMASISQEIAARTITINSPSKSFNLPGLRCAVLHFGSEKLRERFFAKIPRKLIGEVSVIGIEAAYAAWANPEADAWLEQTKAYLCRARDHVASFISREMPEIRMHVPQATYLTWLDCSGMRLNTPAAEFFMKHAGVAFSAGQEFDEDSGQNFVRMNFATSPQILNDMLGRMKQAMTARG